MANREKKEDRKKTHETMDGENAYLFPRAASSRHMGARTLEPSFYVCFFHVQNGAEIGRQFGWRRLYIFEEGRFLDGLASPYPL